MKAAIIIVFYINKESNDDVYVKNTCADNIDNYHLTVFHLTPQLYRDVTASLNKLSVILFCFHLTQENERNFISQNVELFLLYELTLTFYINTLD